MMDLFRMEAEERLSVLSQGLVALEGSGATADPYRAKARSPGWKPQFEKTTPVETHWNDEPSPLLLPDQLNNGLKLVCSETGVIQYWVPPLARKGVEKSKVKS